MNGLKKSTNCKLIISLIEMVNQDEILFDLWQIEIKEKESSKQIIDYITKYSTESNNQTNQTKASLDSRVKIFIQTINSIIILKRSIDSLCFFVGYEQFSRLAKIIETKLVQNNSIKMKIDKLSHLLSLLTNFDHFKQIEELLVNYNYENWFLYLQAITIETNLALLFDKHLDNLQIKELDHHQIDELIETKFNQTETKHNKSLKQIL